MNRIKLLIAMLVVSLLATGCFGPAKVGKPRPSSPPLDGVSKLNIVINRPTTITPMSISLQSHDDREHVLRVIAWNEETGAKVMQDVDADLHQDGKVVVELRLPMNIGYRVMAVEWVETEDGAWKEVVYIGVTEPVDVVTTDPVVVTIDMESALTNPPVTTVTNPNVEGGNLIKGSKVIPHNFVLGGFDSRLVSHKPDGGINYERCNSVIFRPSYTHQYSDQQVTVNWGIYAPIIQQGYLECTFILATEVYEARPEGWFGPFGQVHFLSEPITIRIEPPGGGIEI